MEGLWPIITVVGPVLLIGVVVWLTLRNRRARPGEIARAEQGARDLRADLAQDEAREKAGDDVGRI